MSAPGSVPSSGSRPASTAPFSSYSDYTKYVKEQEAAAAAATYKWDKELWLGQLPTGSKSVHWYRFSSKPETQSLRWEDHGTNNIPYKSTGSEELFQDQLKKSKQTVCWQVLFCLINCEKRPAYFDYSEWHANAIGWIADLTSLALNMPLVVWDHIYDRLGDVKFLHQDLIDDKPDPPVLNIGLHSIVVLSPTDDELPPTIVNLLPLNKGKHYYDRYSRRHGILVPIKQLQWMWSPFNTPQKAATTRNSVQNEAPEPAMICSRVGQICSKNHWPTLTDAIFTCLTILLECHLDRPSTNIPNFEEHFYLDERVRLKYYRWPREERQNYSVSARVPDGVYISTRELWSSLRDELNVHKIFSERISTFIQDHLPELPQGKASTLRRLLERLKLRVLELELSELTLKDRISMYSSAKSTEMAERSIHESKRVILLTALAFFFLPVSLASSIYGMNIQQINDTGHSIQAFVITAIAMCIAAIMLWFTIAQLASKRERLRGELSQSHRRSMTKLERLLLSNPMESLRLRWNYMATVLKLMPVVAAGRQQRETPSNVAGQA